MMRLVLHILALLLVAAGFAALYFAVDLAGIERGTMYAICGTVAVSAGAIVFALAVVAGRLDALATALRREAPAAPAPAAGRPMAPVMAAVAADLAAPDQEAGAVPPPAKAGADAPGGPQPAPENGPASKRSDPPRPEPPKPAPPRLEPASQAATKPAPSAAARDADEALDWLERGLADAPAPSASPSAPPRIVGRYQASGVDYVMFSDGSIEADNGGARRRFGSMEELKAFIAEPAAPRP
jgi:hypothetical protein